MRRVLITGGAGFIGSHLVDALTATGHECTVLDDLSRGSLRNLAHLGGDVEIITGSVTDRDLVEAVAPGHDVVYHLASVVGVRSTIADPARVVEVAVAGTANVLAAASPGTAVVIASSSEVYGRAPQAPFDEETPAVLGPPEVARWSYAHAKACTEHLALAAASAGRVRPAVVRYFNVYGPRMPQAVDPSVVTRFLDAATAGEPLLLHGGGAHTRSFVYVDDAVAGTIAAAERGAGRVINLGSDVETSVRDLAELVIDACGSASAATEVDVPADLGPRFEDPERRSATGALAARVLGWRATTPLAVGLAETAASWPALAATARSPR
ncbi:MAG: NAD-dependent epimerase/dehydratase family protein [Aquihabitans sp.]